VIELSKHTIPKTGLCVIGVARFIGFAVMHMMRYDIDLFGYCFYDKILGKDAPYRMAKAIGLVRTIPVKPNGAMCPHDDHTIDDNRNHRIPRKVFKQEKIKERKHSYKHQETHEGNPILPGPENIDARQCFEPKLFCGGNDQLIVLVFPSVRRRV